MEELLEPIQHLCEQAGSALFVVTPLQPQGRETSFLTVGLSLARARVPARDREPMPCPSSDAAARGLLARGALWNRSWPSRLFSVAAVQMKDEVELRPGGVVVVELHPTPCVPVGAGAAGDREDAVVGVGERALDGDLAAGQEGRPVALPGLPDDDSHAVPLIAADLLLVGAVEHLVRKREHVAGRVARRAVRDRVGGGMGLLATLVGPHPGPARSPRPTGISTSAPEASRCARSRTASTASKCRPRKAGPRWYAATV